jgi:cellulose synthase/poly-beta-1,6-N-acetylglucosamine synthase-like glycosyltransferase
MNQFFIQLNYYFAIISAILVAHNYLYLVIGIFFKSKKYPETDELKKYAILICARNEQKVIGQLLDSLNKQNYPKELIKVFVVADNCNDQTAEISRAKGAVVYERKEPEKARKGYALEFLVKHIEKDFSIKCFDGYMVFDADNLVDKNFVKEMNKAFVFEKGGIITGYRNTKNFDTNIISSGYGFHFYRTSAVLHRPRQILGVGTHLAGTGYLIDSSIMAGGWTFHTLTEDTEFTIHQSAKDHKIKYCEQASFYDEQPTTFKVAIRQRVRWTRGRLSVFLKDGWKLFINIFKRGSFTSYDLFFYLFPWSIITYIGFVLQTLVILFVSLILKQPFDFFVPMKVIYTYILGVYTLYVGFGLLLAFRERKHIKSPLYKILIYALFYPVFELLHLIITPIAILKPRVDWKPIDHNDQRKISDLV